MFNLKYRAVALLLVTTLFAGCDKEKKDLVKPVTGDDFPQVIILSDEGDGGLEDEDKFSFKITLTDRTDPEGEEPGGKVVPLAQDVVVQFAVTDYSGPGPLSDYILGAEAFYEIDDCTTSSDEGIDLNLTFDPATGLGTVRFPAGVEEIEVEFETNDGLFDDDIFNADKREVEIQLTGLTGNTDNVTVNKSAKFTYEIQDDEGIYGEWTLDHTDATEFARFKSLFGLISEDIANLDADDVDEIKIEFEYGEVKVIAVLKETEIIDDCGSPSEENKVIEIEAEIEEIADDSIDGDVEFGEVLEVASGQFREFVFKGGFSIDASKLTLTLEGEFGDDTTDEITLTLEK